MSGRAVALGAQAGFAAGGLAGLAEAVLVLAFNPGLEDAYVLPAAIVGYGILGLFGGAVLSVLLSGAGVPATESGRAKPAWLFTGPFCVVLATLALVVGRFRLVRDVWGEQPPPLVVNLALAGLLLAFTAGLAGSGEWVIRRRGGPVRWGRASAAAVAALAVLTLAGAYPLSRPTAGRPTGAPAPGPAHGPNIVLILVDTLRADRLSAYGYQGQRTPAIDQLAGDGTLYVQAIAQASWTKPSVASLLTSLYPSRHGAVGKADVLPDAVFTLPEALIAAGYHTAAFVNNPNVSSAFNFHQGFVEYHYLKPAYLFYVTESVSRLALYGGLRVMRERFLSRGKDPSNYYRDAREVTDRAIRWLDGRPSRPFFLLLHYMDPHDPYFAHPYTGEAIARVHTPNPDPSQAGRISAFYDGEIAYLDEHLGRLFAYLRQAGLYDPAVILLTADHGEEFYEHGGWWHGTTLYDEQIRIPLFLKLPDRAQAGRRVEEQVRIIDVAPTVLAAAGLPVPPLMQGQSLLGDGPVGTETVFAEEDFEGNRLRAVRGRGWKLIEANPGNPRGLRPNELYHLERDPEERRDLAGVQPGRARELSGLLERLASEVDGILGAVPRPARP